MKKAPFFSLVLLACVFLSPALMAEAKTPQPSVPATYQGPVVQIQGQSGNGCPSNADPSGGECYSCPAGYTLSGTMCDPPIDPENVTVTASPSSPSQAQPSSGSGFVPLAPIPGLTQGVVANSSGLVDFLQNLYKYLIGVAVVLAIVMITWGGIEIAARDSISKQSSGREHITQAIIGLILVLAPVLIFTIINPAILNLSVSLPPLNTQWGTGAAPNNAAPGSGNTPSVPAAPTTAGTYTMISDGTYLKKAIAADQNGVDKFYSDKCGNLSIQAVSCGGSGLKDSSGCTQGTIAWCGSQIQATAYYWKYACAIGSYGCVGDHYVGIAPSYAQQVQSFTSGCQTEGGKVYESAKDTSLVVIPVSCTDTSGYQPYNASQYSGYSCDYTDTFKCNAN